MKYVKMLGLAAVAAMAVMAFIGASSASATVFCSVTQTPCPVASKWPVNTVIDFSLKSGTSAKLVTTTGETLDTCTGSTVKGPVTNAGSSTTTVVGTVAKTDLTWSSCTFPTTTTQGAGLEVHHIPGTDNGTVTASGEFRVTIQTFFFGSCVYGVTAGAHLGTLTGTTATNTHAVFHANAVAKKLVGSEAACPETSKWTAEYTQTEPKNTDLYVEPA